MKGGTQTEKRIGAKGLSQQAKENLVGLLFISPVILGILIFTLIPMISSLYFSFFDYNVITPPKNFGFQNFIRPFGEGWQNFSKSVNITLIFTVVSIPLGIVLSYLLAVVLSKEIKGMKVFRVIYYIPVIIPAVAMGLLWQDILNFRYGIANAILNKLGLASCGFLSMPDTALATFISIGLFGLGGNMVLWIAQFKNIPVAMYEAADIEGASKLKKLLKITIPMSTPMIFYMLILGIIGSLQVFSSSFLVSGGAGPENSLLFYVVNVYVEAFRWMNMGYASALSWILFAVIALLTAVITKTSKWVFYGEDI